MTFRERNKHTAHGENTEGTEREERHPSRPGEQVFNETAFTIHEALLFIQP